MSTKIIGTGSCIPETIIENNAFIENHFYEGGSRINRPAQSIIEKFAAITGIRERRYAKTDQLASDLGLIASIDAINSASIDPEKIDYIIVAHNFGDTSHDTNRVNAVPSIASKIKSSLGIHNPDCVAYDIIYGCPGWVEGLIQAHLYFKADAAKTCLVIGAETLSRVIDPNDRDSMIFSDGAGAAIVQLTTGPGGILSYKSQTFARDYSNLINMGATAREELACDDLYIKMEGRKVYEFALSHVPQTVKAAIDKAGLHISDISKVLIHQANEKMDYAIAERLFELYGIREVDLNKIPMTIDFLGNSSVATVPTLLDLILKGQLPNHSLNTGDIIVMASVGAGMNINAVVYQM